jgi:hypothetical protein
MKKERVECTFPTDPWLHDHAVGGRIILPAVVALEWLAAVVEEHRPDCGIRCLGRAGFSRFLDVPARETTLPLVIELEEAGEDRVQASLCCRRRRGGMTRLVEHARVIFGGQAAGDMDRADEKEVITELSAAEVYNRYVPFGPGWQSLIGTLRMGRNQARGRVRALETGPAGALGSPFPLDGAMHAACVLGQHLVDYIPFPVGFERRVIHRATEPGHEYDVHVRLTGPDRAGLVFDLWIFDAQGQVESVTGLVMQRVSW